MTSLLRLHFDFKTKNMWARSISYHFKSETIVTEVICIQHKGDYSSIQILKNQYDFKFETFVTEVICIQHKGDYSNIQILKNPYVRRWPC